LTGSPAIIVAVWEADLNDIRAEARLAMHPLYRDERTRVVAFLRRVQTARNPSEYFSVHRDLLLRFRDLQELEDLLKSKRDEVRAEIKAFARVSPRPVDSLRAGNNRVRNADDGIRAAKALLSLYRSVADALAWRALRFDRSAIAALGNGQRVGRLASGAGLDAELRELALRWDEDHIFAIHNDITNCLRHGDVTAIRRTGSHVEVGLIEIKAGRQPPASSPQMRRLEMVVALLQRGSHPLAAEGRPLRVDRVPGPYRTYLDTLRALMPKARRDGYAAARPTPSLVIEVMDEQVVLAGDKPASAYGEEMRATLAWNDRSELLRFSSGARILRDRRHAFSQLAPLALLPLDAGDLADLLLGRLGYVVTLHLRALEQTFEQHGIAAKVARRPAARHTFLEATDGPRSVRVPAYVREQMLIELMTPATLVGAVRWLLDNLSDADDEPMNWILGWETEANVWNRYRPADCYSEPAVTTRSRSAPRACPRG
jgi:hypothetical protein